MTAISEITWVCRDCGEVHPDHKTDCTWLAALSPEARAIVERRF